MPTDTRRRRTDAAAFALRSVLWSLGLFGLLRLPWTETHILLPLTRVQAAGAVGLLGAPALPIQITLACSGADALALCFGVVLAYPVMWRTRAAGLAGGAALILGLNILRIGTLGRAAESPEWFSALHVYLWPAVLVLAIAGYVFAWMRFVDRPRADASAANGDTSRTPGDGAGVRLSRRFVVLTMGLLLVFVALSPLYLESAGVFAIAGFVARAAAAILGVAGVSAYAAANVLWTPRGGFLVTQECISTPLIPVYLAAVFSYVPPWRWRLLGVLATLPLFVALGVARLLVVALPGALVASPLFLVHAFYQLLLGAVVVIIAAVWRHGGRAALGHAALGIVAGVLFVRLLGPFYTRMVTSGAGELVEDPQRAIAFLPAFQVGLYLALWAAAFVGVGWKRFVAGLAILALTQTTGLIALHALGTYAGLTAHVRDVRGWAVAGPLLIVAMVGNIARPRR